MDKLNLNRVIVFGAGAFGREYLATADNKTQVVAVMDNDEKKQGTFFQGHKICSPSEVLNIEYDKIIITIDIKSESGLEWAVLMQTQLIKLGVPSEKIEIFRYIEANSKRLNGHILLFAKEYLYERCNNRKLLIYGVGIESKMLSSLLSICGIPVEYYIDDSPSGDCFEGRCVRHWLDIVYENHGSVFIIVANAKECYGLSRQKLMQLGFSEHIDFTYYKAIPGVIESSSFDVTLSFSRVRYLSDCKKAIEGFELFGDVDNSEALKIVALGGSTTESSVFFIKSWAPFLADRLNYNGISTVVYCGGVAGYTSSQELLKMIRDVLPLKPDVVLSYSAFNDIIVHSRSLQKIKFETEHFDMDFPLERENRPFLTNFQVNYIKEILLKYPNDKRNVYYGLQNDKSGSDVWLDNARMMRAISNEYNILFLSFLQPFIDNGYYTLTDSQKIVLNRYWPNLTHPKYQADYFVLNCVNDIKSAIKNINYITDLSHIFQDCVDIYIDRVHVNEQGNQIIASHIYDVLIKHLDGSKIIQ